MPIARLDVPHTSAKHTMRTLAPSTVSTGRNSHDAAVKVLCKCSVCHCAGSCWQLAPTTTQQAAVGVEVTDKPGHPGLGKVAVLEANPVTVCSSQGDQGLSHRALPLPQAHHVQPLPHLHALLLTKPLYVPHRSPVSITHSVEPIQHAMHPPVIIRFPVNSAFSAGSPPCTQLSTLQQSCQVAAQSCVVRLSLSWSHLTGRTASCVAQESEVGSVLMLTGKQPPHERHANMGLYEHACRCTVHGTELDFGHCRDHKQICSN